MYDEATQAAAELEITRPDMDRWALRPHERAIAATDEGRLPDEIVPVTVRGRTGDTIVEIDEGPRRNTSLERLAELPGLVGEEGSHTAGNSPSVNDGAGALVLARDQWASANGKAPLAEIIKHAQSANDVAYLATTPASAAEKALACASGARLPGSLVLELRRRGGGPGCVAICSGGGQGDAVILRVHPNGM